MSEARKLIDAIDPKRVFGQLEMRKEYHFSLGNSSEGPIGFCARVIAHTPEEAVQFLRDALPESLTVPKNTHIPPDQQPIGYIEVYLNPEAITVNDIDEEEPYRP